ncbi:MAG TPA: TPM domain-containing protein [Steroidobacteraceae bacterium]|nr:TPM domain-containing protein [Steroidobacteraceae bacterium]
MSLRRIWRHLLATRWQMQQRFNEPVRQLIAREIKAAEQRHAGEICFAVEAALDWQRLRSGMTPRARALELFASLGVWDTAANNGVLIYLLLADRSVEFVADRGLSDQIADNEWQPLCREVETHYRAGHDAEGCVAAIRGVAALLQKHFPNSPGDRDELPNQPFLL